LVPGEDAAGAAVAQYPFGGRPEPLDQTVGCLVHGQNARMRADLLGPGELSMTVHAQQELTKWGYCFADCEMHPVTVDYRAHPEQPLIAAFQDATEADPGPAILHRDGQRLIVSLPNGCHAAFDPGLHGWTLADGGRTRGGAVV
jgi:hypothetical protein